jgi:hypothetical protein
MSLTVAGLVLSATEVLAQGAFPAPLPSQSTASPFPPVNNSLASSPAPSPFPPVNGAAASPFPPVGGAPAMSAAPVMGAPGMGGTAFGGPPPGGPPGGDECVKQFLPLRQDAEKKIALIKTAGARKVPPDEACKLFVSYSAAEVKMINFFETNAKKCGIPSDVAKQVKDGHVNTEKMKTTVCNAAAQRQQGGPVAPSLSDALGTSSALPEIRAAKKGGSTFETLNGNALSR